MHIESHVWMHDDSFGFGLHTFII